MSDYIDWLSVCGATLVAAASNTADIVSVLNASNSAELHSQVLHDFVGVSYHQIVQDEVKRKIFSTTRMLFIDRRNISFDFILRN